MRFNLGGIVKRNVKALIVLTVLCLPVAALFQNCGKVQNFQMTDESLVSKASVNTNDLPSGVTQIDQVGDSSGEQSGIGTPQSGTGTGDTQAGSGDGVAIDDPSQEVQDELEIEDSLAACAALENSSESNNINGAGVFSSDFKSASNINGKHVLSSKNFNGNNQITSISNSRGALTICGLDVGTLSNYGGKVTLVNSKIEVINSLNGRLVVLEGSSAGVRNSKVAVRKIK